MEIKGTENFKHSIEHVWNCLHDPDILKKVIPGCEELIYKGEGDYEVKLKLGVASVKGEYTGKVSIEDVNPPYEYILKASGSGSPGHVDVSMNCRLQEKGEGTAMEWECQAEIGGMIAGVGSRVLSGIAKYMAGKFFKDMKKLM